MFQKMLQVSNGGSTLNPTAHTTNPCGIIEKGISVTVPFEKPCIIVGILDRDDSVDPSYSYVNTYYVTETEIIPIATDFAWLLEVTRSENSLILTNTNVYHVMVYSITNLV